MSNSDRKEPGAPGRTRTSTGVSPPDFESGASTSSATGACGVDNTGGFAGSTQKCSAVPFGAGRTKGEQVDSVTVIRYAVGWCASLAGRASVARYQMDTLPPDPVPAFAPPRSPGRQQGDCEA